MKKKLKNIHKQIGTSVNQKDYMIQEEYMVSSLCEDMSKKLPNNYCYFNINTKKI